VQWILGGVPRVPVTCARLDRHPVAGSELPLVAIDLDHPLAGERLPGLGEVLMEVGIGSAGAGGERALELHVRASPFGDLDPGPGLRARVALADLEHGGSLSGRARAASAARG